MKPLDKALLTQELSELIHGLKDGTLSYFDHARAKQRLLEIQHISNTLLHQPNFKRNQQALEPLLAAQDFLYHCRYREYCCGTFTTDHELEDVLYQQSVSSWALHYDPEDGWHIWLLQMPKQTLLISDSGELDEVYAWLVTQQMKYQCFGREPETIQVATTNVSQPALTSTPLPIDTSEIDNAIEQLDSSYQAHMQKIEDVLHGPIAYTPDVLAQKDTQKIRKKVLQETQFSSDVPPQPVSIRRLRKQEVDISEGLSFDLGLEPIQINPDKPIQVPPLFSAPEPSIPQVVTEPTFDLIDFNAPEPVVTPATNFNFATTQQEAAPIAIEPTPPLESAKDVHYMLKQRMLSSAVRAKKSERLANLVLNGQSCKISALLFEAAQEKQLYRLLPEELDCEHVDLILHYTDMDHVFERTIYLAEQTDQQGRFIKYLALLGAVGELQAIRLAHLFTQAQGHKLAAVRSIDWPNLEQNLFNLDDLFNTYQALGQLIWSNNHYYPFIPAHFLQTQKFIQFAETPANVTTPILLLKERQKIRVIHGEERLNLYANESAYPYLLLDRQQGITWQLIREVIQTLPQPIDPITLYKAICMHAS